MGEMPTLGELSPYTKPACACAADRRVSRPSRFYFLSWDQKPARRRAEAAMRRQSPGHRLKRRTGEFKEADLTRCAIDLLVWVHREDSDTGTQRLTAPSPQADVCRMKSCPVTLVFYLGSPPATEKKKALRTEAVRWSHERVAVSDVAASSIWLYPCQRLLMFVYRVHNSCRLSCSIGGCECIKCVLSGSVFFIFFPPSVSVCLKSICLGVKTVSPHWHLILIDCSHSRYSLSCSSLPFSRFFPFFLSLISVISCVQSGYSTFMVYRSCHV